ncbi:ATP-binding cassette domain-containing protein [Ammoniphilus oxalaticus]|uniref:ATP-binding cassette domain-containing protein n=1 Tax=Ammoniphilus oxalaticus TaxID=66863 RepID=UPI000E75AD07
MTLTLKNISKSFSGQLVLKDISIDIQKGEFVSLLGPSGSGKSTLFNLIGGLLSPDDGDIYLDEKRITNKTGYISYMPQQASLFAWRSVLENALLGQELSGKKDTEQAKIIVRKSRAWPPTECVSTPIIGGDAATGCIHSRLT